MTIQKPHKYEVEVQLILGDTVDFYSTTDAKYRFTFVIRGLNDWGILLSATDTSPCVEFYPWDKVSMIRVAAE